MWRHIFSFSHILEVNRCANHNSLILKCLIYHVNRIEQIKNIKLVSSEDNTIDVHIIIYLLSQLRSTIVAFYGNLPPTDSHHHNGLGVTFVGRLHRCYSGSVCVVSHSHFMPQSIKQILIKNGCLRLCANLKTIQ